MHSIDYTSPNAITKHVMPQVNTFTTNFHTTFTKGIKYFQSLYTISNEWIIDSCITNHEISSFEMFNLYRVVLNMHIKFFNSQLVPITHIGEDHLSPMLVLHNSLYIPHFTLNLIYVNKFLNDSPCYLTFQNIFYIIQDIHTQIRIGLAKER